MAARLKHLQLFRRQAHWSSYSPPVFTSTPAARRSFAKKALWLLPAGAGLFLFVTPSAQKSLIPTLISSPTVIPCPPSTQRSQEPLIIRSPYEEHLSWRSRILSILRTRIWHPILTAKRFVYLCILFLPVIVTSPMLLVGKPEKRYHGDGWGAIWWYDFLVSRMEAAGPTFIKLSQWAASRADLFPSFLCDRLGSLHSRGKPHSIHHTRKVIERVFQRPFDQVFEEFGEEPIGSGAIAQVYRAILKQDLIPPSYLGPRRHRTSTAAISPVILQDPLPSVPTAAVAIKVLHPGVSKLISRDLSIMSFFADFIDLFPGMQWLSLPEEVQVFGDMMFQQLDLRHEAENLLTFETNFAPRRVPVNFPRPLNNWSTQELLIEEYQNALPMEMFLKNGGGPFDEQVATVGLDAFLNMLLLDNFVHSDLHPGNIMIKFSKPASTAFLLKNLWNSMRTYFSPSSPNSEVEHIIPPDYSESDSIVSHLRSLSNNRSAWLQELSNLREDGYIPEIVFIDAGLVTTLSATNRRNFLDLFRALAEFDGYRAGQLMVERCRSPELAIDTETFALKMQHLILSIKRKTFSLGQIKITDVLTDALKCVRQHHVKMEADFINTVISILLLEGIGRQLDPGLDLFKSALPILRQLGGQMATRESMKRELNDLPKSELGAFLKVWVWLEAREFISASIVNADDLVKYDWLTFSV
ncbi:protein kinase [Dendrothele bispora CBS 962.96]|uniref:Protein kinase n=1 Tax=Dendrothele bispora (strain CBS 962.96) TaxID=1314807 RepID=A0A4S8MW61_DENBC|nr:protein kinase [Dendrothele bispora CBS 962.96]